MIENTTDLSDDDYILYVAEHANFSPETMLIPAKKFLLNNKRFEDYKVLSNNKKKINLIKNGETILMDNVIIKNIIWKDRIGHPEHTEYSNIISYLDHYASHGDPDDTFVSLNFVKDSKGEMQIDHSTREYVKRGLSLINDNDEFWFNGTIRSLCGGFNSIAMYEYLIGMTEYNGQKFNIVDSFLVLEATNGILNFNSDE